MNRKQRLEELKRLLDEQYRNLERGSGQNFNAKNSDSKNSKFEKLTDSSTINTNEKPSKFEQNPSCASDYNKEPLALKDRTNFYIVFATVCTLAIMIFMYSYEPNQTRYNQLRSREIFYAIKHRTIKPRNKIETAAFFYFQIAASFGAKGEHFAMPKGRSAKNIYRDFRVYSRRLKRATIENLSYEKLIKEYDSEDSLFYLDPPYVGTENYYKTAGGFSKQDHEALAEIL